MDATAWAAVQAIGSILAIVAGFWTVWYQNRHADRMMEAERERRAEVVAYRLSGWLGEVGSKVEQVLERCQERQSKVGGPPRAISEIVPELRLHIASSVDAVLPELYYLSSGSGDVAQVAYLAGVYDAWLVGLYEQATKRGVVQPMLTGIFLRDFYTRAETQLTAMKTLQAEAKRHIAPLVEQAIKKGR